jgi:hypothetical protein
MPVDLFQHIGGQGDVDPDNAHRRRWCGNQNGDTVAVMGSFMMHSGEDGSETASSSSSIPS